MENTEYIEQRVDAQINWYDRKSQTNQRAYKWLRVYEITAAAMIPFLSGYSDRSEVKFSVGLIGVTIAIVSGALALYHLQENWVQYRSASEALKSEKYLYLTQAPPYDTDQAFELFVQKVEALISKENSGWQQVVQKSEKTPPKQ